MGYEFLLVLPLFSAISWAFVAVALFDRPPFGDLAGRFFVLLCLTLAGYALFDWLALTAGTAEQALRDIRASYILGFFAVAFLFLMARRLAGIRENRDLWVILVPSLMVPVVVGPMVAGTISMSWGFRADVQAEFYLPWATAGVVIAIAGLYYLLRVGKVTRQAWRPLGWPLSPFTASLIAMIALSLAANIAGAVTGADVPRLLSSFLFIPAVALGVTVLRPSRETLSEAMSDLLRENFNVLQGVLVFRGGKLIASASKGPGVSIDEDIMTGMLDAIQSFLGQSFPFVEDGSLMAIEQADMRLLVEKGRFSYLVLVIQGREDPVLRSRMADALRRFEIDNFDFLTDWKGDTSQIPDCASVFQPFIPRAVSG